MSDLYASPPDHAYLVATPFDMPTETGSIWAIAFTSNSSRFLNAALAIIFTLIFPWLWGLICVGALLYTPHNPSRRRSVALVTLCNAREPWSAFKSLAVYTYDSFRFVVGNETEQTTSWNDTLYGLAFSFIALAIFAVSMTMGIIGPSFLHIGNVAPVRSTVLSLDEVPPPDLRDNLLNRNYASLPDKTVKQAVGGVDSAADTIRSKVYVSVDGPNRTDSVAANGSEVTGNVTVKVTYGYSMTGLDLGLPHGSDLEYSVNGSCITEYKWVREFTDEDNWSHDFYRLWPEHEDLAIVDFYAGRAGNDRFRPALSCWQHDKWTYGTERVNSIFDLRFLPNMKLPSVFLQVLENTFSYPIIKTVGSVAGMNALDAPVQSFGVLDAEQASIERDMTRLIMASYLSSLNVFVYATTDSGEPGRNNIFTGENGAPREGAEQLVVRTGNVETYSLSGLISLATLVVVILLIKLLLFLKLLLHRDHETSRTTEGDLIEYDDRWTRIKAMTATQLLRNVYESGQGSPRAGWSCGEVLPDITDTKTFKLIKCRDGETCCGGHIAKDPEIVVSRRESYMSGSVALAGQEKQKSP
ncbi:hypothetical protein N656DRAFT_798653 [Canariomyces notabilis]|uniref:Uncharacterized protein n=1 Tax=Canariomyces notabilis TaxID=2074819 RepID=A0AAN6TDB2_9PEZI|nr:hypothetical protein N656DRAFT_798653 [Canariomyces arenarius]